MEASLSNLRTLMKRLQTTFLKSKLSPIETLFLTITGIRFDFLQVRGFANHKSQYLYKSLPVKTKMAFLSWKLIFLAILLHGQFIHYTQISLHPNIHFFNAQQRAYQSFFRNFLFILFTS